MKKFIKILLITGVALSLIGISVVVLFFAPIMTGMTAKTVCSCTYVAGRSLESIREKELQVFPGLSSATIDINNTDSTVSASLLFSTSKAIYRQGLGCTLLAQQSEEEVRNQPFKVPPPPIVNTDSLPWPYGDFVRDTVFPTLNYTAIHKAVNDAFVDVDSTKPANTLAVLVLYDGNIVAEKYADGISKHSRLMGWSMTKSLTNALIGMLVKDGKLQVDSLAPVAEWQNDERRKITLNNLLQASSGLQWSETYFNPFEDFHTMFIKSDDKGGFAATLPLQHPPGTHFQYSSGTTNILSRMIRQQVGDATYHRFPYERLFYKIGMYHTVVEPDASGTFVGSSYGWASARDWARFGLLFLQDGVWNGERILPEGWVKFSTTPASTTIRGEYGAHWWLNAGAPDDSLKREHPLLPTETYWADGFEGQNVMIIPSRKLVIVRLGVSHHGFDIERMVKEILDATNAQE
jgi:CubicO group peptidase (beta-lactamase class C family)